MSVTLKDIAEACGVSRPTVNLILTGRGDNFAPATRDKVIAAAAKLGYRRNAAARTIQNGRFDAIAVLLEAEEPLGMIAAGLLSGIERFFHERGMHLTIAHAPSPKSGQLSQKVPKVLSEALVDGLLVKANYMMTDELRELINAQPKYPVVWMGEPQKENAIYPDEEHATKLLVEHLISLGHRRISFLGPLDWTVFELISRRDSYVATMKSHSLKPDLVDLPMGQQFSEISDLVKSWDERVPAVSNWLKRPSCPTAVVAFSSREASMLQTLALRDGVKIPEELSIVTYSDWVVNLYGQPITGAWISMSRFGITAAEMLLDRIKSGGERVPTRAMKYSLVQGRTTAPPARRK